MRDLTLEDCPYPVATGCIETMERIAAHGLRGLNPITHKWQVINKLASYLVVKDAEPLYDEEGGEHWGATLYSNMDLLRVKKERGLI